MTRLLERRTFVLVCLLAVAVRMALVATTYGTNDVGFKATWAELVSRVGISGAYAYTRMLNHPPESLLMMQGMKRLADAMDVAFGDVFRSVQVLADVATSLALYTIGLRLGGPGHAQKLALFVLLSPAAGFLSGFHGNTDPTMSALLMVAVALFFAKRPALSGVALAMAVGIKIPPLLVAPLFAMYFPRSSRYAFVTAFAITGAVLFLPAVVIGGPVVVRNIFGYAGNLPYEWGVPGVAFAISRNVPAASAAGQSVMKFYIAYGRYFEYLAIIAVWLLAFRKRDRREKDLPQLIAIMLMTVLVLAPGFGVQYMSWIVALLPFALPWRGAVAVNAAISLFLFVTYTVWSGGWPWWFADIARPASYRYVAALAGYAMWAILCVTLGFVIRRFLRTCRS